MLGALIAIILGFRRLSGGDGGLARRASYTPFALSIAILGGLGTLLAIRALLATRDRQHSAPIDAGAIHTRLFRELSEVFRNQSFRTLFVGVLSLFTSLSIHATLGLHANTYFWRMTPGQTQAVTLSLFAGLLLGAPLAGPMLKVMEKRTVLLIGMVGLALAFSVPVMLRLLGGISVHRHDDGSRSSAARCCSAGC